MKEIESMENIYVICRNEGFLDLNIHHVGGYWIWITFPTTSACSIPREYDYTDLSSNHKYKDVDHVSESIDDQQVDDIKIIQSKLKKIDDHDLDVEPDLEGENKDGERDESIASPNKKLKEDIKTTYLDLSRPPRFEFMKKSSSSTSKFSTSFGSHRKSDIKGVSLINELNQIIEVCTALGESNRKVIALEELSSIDKKIDDGLASQADKENQINIIHEIENLDSLESIDLLQNAHIKWDVEGDENSKFFHRLINQERSN
nr:RNA-directed DNA polymerase, eukaryota, reverse transcriptase zinc-binding domain protein [Tanacetum cinerariifolium]